MKFQTVLLEFRTPSGLLEVQVAPEAVEMLWDDVCSSQTGPEIVEQHRSRIEEAVRQKLAGAMTAPMELVIGKEDLEKPLV